MGNLEQMARNAALAGYIRKLDIKRIWEVGCGPGTLLEHLQRDKYDLYVGTDISGEALKKAALKRDSKTHFIQANGAEFLPRSVSVDAVVFNESLYYLNNDPRVVLNEYRKAVKPRGYILTSLYTETKRIREIDRQLKKYDGLELVHETTVQTNDNKRRKTWMVSVWRTAEKSGDIYTNKAKP